MADQPEQLPNDDAKYLISLNQHQSDVHHPPTERPAAGADAAGPSDTLTVNHGEDEHTAPVTSTIKSIAIPGRVSLTGNPGILSKRKSSLEQLRAHKSTDVDAPLAGTHSEPPSTESKLEPHDDTNKV